MTETKNKTELEAQYRKIQMDSSSSLKEFSLDRRKYYKKYVLNERVEEEEPAKAATIGRVVETLLLEKEEFDNRFYMSGLNSAPTGLMLAFVEALYRNTRDNTDGDGNLKMGFDAMLQAAYTESGFKIKFPAVLEKFTGSDAEIYYNEILEVRGKNLTVVTLNEITNAEKIVEELKNNQFVGPIINLETNKRYEVINQLQVEGYEVDGHLFKSMMDKVVIDHEKKTIQVYDLKCTWSVENFLEEYYLYRRSYIQAYLYKEACESLIESRGLTDYTVEYPKFIVCDSINYYKPLIYTLSYKDMMEAYEGFEYKGRKYPGVKEIILDLEWALLHNEWRISRKNNQSGGFVNIK